MSERVILASASPTRARLLESAAVDFRVEPAALDEAAIKETFRAAGRGAGDCALALAEVKARRVAKRHNRVLVVGADQILVFNDLWLEKPPTLGAARAQLKALRGHTHELATAVCAVQDAARIWHTVSWSRLTMREFGDTFLDEYIGAEAPDVLGSVGAYRLEGRGVQLFERIEGDYFSILGLPLLELLGFLRDRGHLLS
jgi:septum formation protein